MNKEFSAADLVGRTTLFRKEERSFSVGDRIIALKNDSKLDLQNGTLGVIRELDEKGQMLVDLGDRKVQLDLKKYRQVDHAYAVTIHKSQGSTVEHSIMYTPVRPGKFSKKSRSLAEGIRGTAYNALNVAVIRARFGTRSSPNRLQVSPVRCRWSDGKTSTLTRLREPERDFTPSILEKNQAQPKRELRLKIKNLERVMLRPEACVRRAPSLDYVFPCVLRGTSCGQRSGRLLRCKRRGIYGLSFSSQ